MLNSSQGQGKTKWLGKKRGLKPSLGKKSGVNKNVVDYIRGPPSPTLSTIYFNRVKKLPGKQKGSTDKSGEEI